MGSKVLELSLPKKNEIDTYFIAGDWHSLYCHEEGVNILIGMAKKVPKKNRKLIINGDFVDLPHLMQSKLATLKDEAIKGNIDTIFLPQTLNEWNWANATLDRLQKVFDVIIYSEGNHDWRAKHFMEKHAPEDYKKYFDLRYMLNLDHRNIQTIEYNDWIDIGHVSITHGMYHGTTALKKHYEASGGRNVIFSHVHQLEAKSFVRRANTAMAWSLPAMCELNPDYIKNRDNNWSNGFGILNVRSSGLFNFNVIQIWDDIATDMYGKIYKG